jgi:hypothetical protein
MQQKDLPSALIVATLGLVVVGFVCLRHQRKKYLFECFVAVFVVAVAQNCFESCLAVVAQSFGFRQTDQMDLTVDFQNYFVDFERNYSVEVAVVPCQRLIINHLQVELLVLAVMLFQMVPSHLKRKSNKREMTDVKIQFLPPLKKNFLICSCHFCFFFHQTQETRAGIFPRPQTLHVVSELFLHETLFSIAEFGHFSGTI